MQGMTALTEVQVCLMSFLVIDELLLLWERQTRANHSLQIWFYTNQPRNSQAKRKGIEFVPHFCVSCSIIDDGCNLTSHIDNKGDEELESSNTEVEVEGKAGFEGERGGLMVIPDGT